MATDEVQVILDFAAAVRHQEGRLIHHLDNRASIQRYRRKADEVAAIVGKRRILDWGCGFGQMTFLLERCGLSVVPFDIESSRRPHTLCDWVGREPEYVSDLMRLPFSTAYRRGCGRC